VDVPFFNWMVKVMVFKATFNNISVISWTVTYMISIGTTKGGNDVVSSENVGTVASYYIE
jgi:hypothetical protein